MIGLAFRDWLIGWALRSCFGALVLLTLCALPLRNRLAASDGPPRMADGRPLPLSPEQDLLYEDREYLVLDEGEGRASEAGTIYLLDKEPLRPTIIMRFTLGGGPIHFESRDPHGEWVRAIGMLDTAGNLHLAGRVIERADLVPPEPLR